MNFENIAVEVEKEGIDIEEHNFNTNRLKGLYVDGTIAINTASAITQTEKACILAEELGHYHTSYGNILDQNNIQNVKQEKRARNWAYEKLVPLDKFIEAYKSGVKNRYELAAFLDVIEDFLEEAINHYKEKYGIYVKYGDYTIYFEPLGIFKEIK